MFLVGLTGSAIPYLIFLGIVIVFTFGTNTEVLNKKCLPQEKSDMHLTYSEQTTEHPQFLTFNYTEHHYFHKQSVDESDSFSITDNSKPVSNPVVRMNYAFITMHYSSSVCANYFGLSPPIVA